MTLSKRPLLDPHLMMDHFKRTLGLPLLLFVLLAWYLKGRNGLLVSVVFAVVVGTCLWYLRGSISDYLNSGVHHSKNMLTAAHFGREYGANAGAPYVVTREPMRAASGHPCLSPPWGAISAINLETGKFAWETTLGTMVKGEQTGTWNVGGPLVTAGGLVFTAASQEAYLRAFDSATGAELWKGRLPAAAQATPMSYSLNGKQYVVISAGGHFAIGTVQADSIVAFALP